MIKVKVCSGCYQALIIAVGNLREGQASPLLLCISDRGEQEEAAVVLTSTTGAREAEQQGQAAGERGQMQGSHVFFVLKVKSSTLSSKTLHSEGTE